MTPWLLSLVTPLECQIQIGTTQVGLHLILLTDQQCPERNEDAAAAQGRRCRRACSSDNPCPDPVNFKCLCAQECGKSCVRTCKSFTAFPCPFLA